MSGKILPAIAAALIVASTGLADAKSVKRHAHVQPQQQFQGLYGSTNTPSSAPGAPGTSYDAPPYHYGWVSPN
jgi:hypothetical protein